MRTVIVLNQDAMGHGDPELGRRILKSFLVKSGVFAELDAIVFFNSGVRLVGAESPVRAELENLLEHGVDLVPCGTCVEALGVKVAVGRIGDMGEIVRRLAAAAKVITL
jgi:hypothetical protein